MSSTTDPTLLLEFVGGFPAPPATQLQHGNTALLQQYLNSWTRTFGGPNHQEGGDFEHFVETMARFDAAGRAFGYANTSVRNQAGEHLSSLTRLIDGSPILPAEEAAGDDPDFIFGPVAHWGSGHAARSRNSSPADRYWDIPAFAGLSGRRWELAGYFPDDQNEPELLGVLQGMFDDGVRRFVVKGTEPKTLLVKFTLTVRPTDLIGRGTEIPAELTNSVQHLEGRSGVFLVQEHIPMTHEYRVFMAGPKPASGAGCIEDFTPLDAQGAAFDPRFEIERGSGEIVRRQWMVTEMETFARSAGALLHGQAPDLGAAWVMDLAMNARTGEIVVIELNPARNAGLYASSPSAWMGAVREYVADRQR